MSKTIRLAYLYPNEMNTYGDWGNVLCLLQRMRWRKQQVELVEYRIGDVWPERIDMIFMGGGQDSGQLLVEADFLKCGRSITDAINDGIPALTICGAYQLLGRSFTTFEGLVLEGIGLFDMVSQSKADRIIGNIVIDSEIAGELIGFENHSGRTILQNPSQALGRVLKGGGNNGTDKTEGILHHNAVGTYLHGPILPKNPRLADWLIAAAQGITVADLEPLSDPFVDQARTIAASRPR